MAEVLPGANVLSSVTRSGSCSAGEVVDRYDGKRARGGSKEADRRQRFEAEPPEPSMAASWRTIARRCRIGRR
jgi:hypothetical protein